MGAQTIRRQYDNTLLRQHGACCSVRYARFDVQTRTVLVAQQTLLRGFRSYVTTLMQHLTKH